MLEHAGGPAAPVPAPNRTFVRLVVLLLLYPPGFAILFALIGLPLPTYLFCTVVGIVILLTSTRFSLRIYPYANRQSLVAAALLLTIYVSAAYTVSPVAWLEKVIFITYTIVVPLALLHAAYFFRPAAPGTLALLEASLYRHAVPILWVISLCLVLLGKSNDNGRLTLPGIENTIWVSRFVGVLSVVVFCSAARRAWRQPLQMVTLALALFGMVLVGSRAPLLALMVVLVVYHYRHSGKSSALLVLALVAAVLVVAYFTIGGYVFDTGFYSLYDRLDILSAFDGFSGFPVGGFGVGSFGIITTGIDYLFYPHNLMAEVFFEQGFLGLALLLVLVVIVVRDFQFDLRGYLLIYYFVNSLGSGDIPSNNDFFIMVFLCALPLAQGQYRRRLRERPAPGATAG